jgi:thioredoxin reductase (NADPH)
MLTIDDLRTIPLFSALGAAELELLAQTVADLHLGAGEFAVHEGGDRALFAVLAGRIEVVKTVDGIERTLGWRAPGTIFGEVPLAIGSPFPGGYRAAEPSRVLRVEPRQYYQIAAASPDVALKVGALARERLGGPQVLATGVSWRRLAIDGFDRLIGKGIYYRAARSEASARLNPVKRVASAVGEGSMAIAFIHKHLQEAAR